MYADRLEKAVYFGLALREVALYWATVLRVD